MAYRFELDRRQPGVYHVWGKVPDGRWLFRDDEDRRRFEWLIERHLVAGERWDARGRAYVNLREEVRLCARNLLSSHYHLVLWQKVAGGIDRLMRRVIATYTRYYHRKYGAKGALFPGRYRARLIEGRKSFCWRIAYVHKNHLRFGLEWSFSTHRRFIQEDPPSWLEIDKTLEAFGGRAGYEHYMDRYRLRKELDDELRTDGPPF